MIFTPYMIVSNDLDNQNIKLVYNTLTTALIALDEKDYMRIFVNSSFSEKERMELIFAGFLWCFKSGSMYLRMRWKSVSAAV